MAKGSGRLMYVPKPFIRELDEIKKRNGNSKNADAFKDAAKYCQVGREVDHMRSRILMHDIWGTQKRKK